MPLSSGPVTLSEVPRSDSLADSFKAQRFGAVLYEGFATEGSFSFTKGTLFTYSLVETTP